MRKNLCTCKRNNVRLMRSSRTEVMLYKAMALVGDKTEVKAQNIKKEENIVEKKKAGGLR